MYGPIRNNFGTRATVYLGRGRAGLIEQGRRYLFADGRVTLVQSDQASLRVAAVSAIPEGLGGGYLFLGPAGLFFAKTFDGTLLKLTDDASTFVGVAPNSVLVAGEHPFFVSTADGREIAGAPKAERVFPHRNGFALASSELSKQVWFCSSGNAWKPTSVEPIQSAVEDGDALSISVGCSPGEMKTNGSACKTANCGWHIRAVTIGERLAQLAKANSAPPRIPRERHC